ncbi:DNA-binding transcriptional regulator LsrR (DeoR family) [Microbacterium sp. W4I4]|uniref:sugar-binding transcriptional regulator n=1 Tax=Microbacterium sp. W4I4 TaxID=3042295 RepID=UPI002781A462|nr:sugar-binding domain-containing protein [Microbacterium sp. W4I4]MDQ0613645.1 DNA-binding transcriptional regulator LsrR (DeoR family) [Microbacterium sp. W4I4]
MRYAYAAVEHLQHGRSTVDLGEEFGVSRFAVGRMIQRAKDDGLVEVRTRLPGSIDGPLSGRIAAVFGLSAAFVVRPQSEQEERIRLTLAEVGAQVLQERIKEDDVIGLGPGRTLLEMSRYVTDAPNCDIVQLTGSATTASADSLRAISAITHVARGRMFPLHAPFFITDAAAARAISAQPLIRQTLQRMDRLDLAVLSVGGWPDASLLAGMLRDSGDLDDIMAMGGVAEFGSTVLDADGREVDVLAERLIGISTEQLRRVPVKIAIGGGPGKSVALLATLRSGLVDVLVTDAQSARHVLEAS